MFAIGFLMLALFLLVNLGDQTTWVKRTKLAAQPAFWPTVAVIGMSVFGALHLLSSAISPRIWGRLEEVTFWIKSFEYALWFMIYVMAVPYLGYLPSTIVFCVTLTLRLGYRGTTPILAAIGAAIAIVVLFKTFLQVKVPGGKIYEMLPDGARAFMLTYF